MLHQISEKLISSIQVNQWKNYSAVMKWFRNIENKNNSSFIVFAIGHFYTSIWDNL